MKLIVVFILTTAVSVTYGTETIPLSKWGDLNLLGYCVMPETYLSILDTLRNDFGGEKDHREIRGRLNAYLRIRDKWLRTENRDNFALGLLVTQLMQLFFFENIYSALNTPGIEGDAVSKWEREYISHLKMDPEYTIDRFSVLYLANGSCDRVTGKQGATLSQKWTCLVKRLGLRYEQTGEMLFLRVPHEEPVSYRVADMCKYIKFGDETWVLQRCAFVLDQQKHLTTLYDFLGTVGALDSIQQLNEYIQAQRPLPDNDLLFLRASKSDYQYYPRIFAGLMASMDIITWRCSETPDCK